MIKLSTIQNFVLFTEENGDSQAIGKLQLTYKIDDTNITFFILKEGNKKIYTVPYFSCEIDNLEVDGVFYSKDDLPSALSNIFLPPSGSAGGGDVTQADINYLQNQINVNKTNINKCYYIASYNNDLLTLTTLNGVDTVIRIPYFDKTQYYLKSEINTLLNNINSILDTKANKDDVYSKTDINNKFDAIDIDPTEITNINTNISNLENGTIKSVVYTALDGKLTVTDYKGNVTSYSIPFFDSSKYYTKTEVDTKLGDYVTKTYVDNGLSLKADKSTTYSKTEVDSKINAIPTFDGTNYYTKTQIDSSLSLKADKSTTYTKTEVDTKLGDYATKTNTYTKTEVNTLLTNKADVSSVYTKSQTYTQTEVNSLLTGKANVGDSYTKTETDGKISNLQTQIDGLGNLSNYYTKSETDNKLNLKVNSADVYSKTEVDTKLSTKANSADVYTKSQTYSKTETDNLLANKADKSTTYTKTEVDNKLNIKANSADVYTKSQTYSKTEIDTSNTTINNNITAVDSKFTNYYTKTETDAKYITKNTYTNVSVTETTTTCDFTTYNYYNLTLTGTSNSVTITANNLPEFGKAYYISVINNRSVDVDILGLSSITGDNPLILAGGIAEISVMKWGDGTIKMTFIVSQ